MYLIESKQNIISPIFYHLQVAAQGLQDIIVKRIYISTLEERDIQVRTG